MNRIVIEAPASLDAVHYTLLRLIHILDSANSILDQQDLGQGAERNWELDKAASLFATAQSFAEGIDSFITENYQALNRRATA